MEKGRLIMVSEVFATFWRELKDFYGKETKSRFDMESESVLKNVPSSKAQEVLTYIIHNYEFFPKLPELRNIALRFEVIKKAAVSDEKCLYCLGSGVLKYYRESKELPYKPEYFAACVCSHGDQYRNKPFKDIRDVFGTRTTEELRRIAERNGGRRNVEELKKDFCRSLDIMNLRNQSFKAMQEEA
jgi:hypothetical protein